MGKVVLSTRIEERIGRALEEVKWRNRISKSKLIEEAIKEYLKNHYPEVYKEFLDEENGKGD